MQTTPSIWYSFDFVGFYRSASPILWASIGLHRVSNSNLIKNKSSIPFIDTENEGHITTCGKLPFYFAGILVSCGSKFTSYIDTEVLDIVILKW